MKRAPFLLSTFALAVVLFSCKHEPPAAQSGPSGPTDTSQSTKNLLGTVVKTSGTTATTFTYRYDAQNRLIWYSNTSTDPSYFEDTSQVVWDNNGRISQIIYRSDTSSKFPDPSVDSIVYNVVFDATASKYLYKLTQYKMYNTKFKDSTAYTYNTQGQIGQENDYYFDYVTTKTYIKWATYDYSYNTSGDLTDKKTTYFDIDANHSDYTFDFAYTYDADGINLLNLGNDAIIIGLSQNCSGHVPKTAAATYPTDSKWNENLSYVYNYNTKYRPLKADVTNTISGAKSTLVFTYQ